MCPQNTETMELKKNKRLKTQKKNNSESVATAGGAEHLGFSCPLISQTFTRDLESGSSTGKPEIKTLTCEQRQG